MPPNDEPLRNYLMKQFSFVPPLIRLVYCSCPHVWGLVNIGQRLLIQISLTPEPQRAVTLRPGLRPERRDA